MIEILLTGAAQGIGRAIAQKFAGQPVKLHVVDLQEAEISELIKELEMHDAEVKGYAGDLQNPQVRASLKMNIHKLDVLINNAGITHKPMPFTEIDELSVDRHFVVNVKVPFMLTQLFWDQLAKSDHGYVFNITSSANIEGYEQLSIYSASKAALSSLNDSLAKETRDSKVKFVDIMPSRTNTPMQEYVRGKQVASDSQSPEVIAEVISEIVAGEIAVKSGDNVHIRDGKYKIDNNSTNAVWRN